MTVRVKLWGSLRTLTEGEEFVEVDARTLRDVKTAIVEKYPALEGPISRGVSFAVDGEIHRDDLRLAVTQEQEIVMMPRMVGG